MLFLQNCCCILLLPIKSEEKKWFWHSRWDLWRYILLRSGISYSYQPSHISNYVKVSHCCGLLCTGFALHGTCYVKVSSTIRSNIYSFVAVYNLYDRQTYTRTKPLLIWEPPSRGRAGGTPGTSAAAPGIGIGRAGYGLGTGSGGQGRLGTVLGELYCNVLYLTILYRTVLNCTAPYCSRCW